MKDDFWGRGGGGRAPLWELEVRNIQRTYKYSESKL